MAPLRVLGLLLVFAPKYTWLPRASGAWEGRASSAAWNPNYADEPCVGPSSHSLSPALPRAPDSCRSADCRNERLYLGEEKRNGEVITASGNKWSNVEYWEHMGLREYMPYMFGGGYVFSSDIARALHLANQASRGRGC